MKNPVFPTNNSCDNNTMICIAQEETTVYQEVDVNVAVSNEPSKCNHRASRTKKPSDKNDFFYAFEI
jgi:hypothetical protein